jgi:hypothetical protein
MAGLVFDRWHPGICNSELELYCIYKNLHAYMGSSSGNLT